MIKWKNIDLARAKHQQVLKDKFEVSKWKEGTPFLTYIDMDGVIADFFKALALEFGVNHWKDIPTQEDVIERLKGTDFFSRIPIFPTTIKFLHMIERYTKGRWAILSTPLKGDEENSSKHKDIWLDNLFGYAFDNDFNKKRFYSDKKWMWATDTGELYSGIPNLLIDDRPTNLEEFKAKGGLTIRYQANESKLDKFEQKLKDLFQPLATKELQHG